MKILISTFILIFSIVSLNAQQQIDHRNTVFNGIPPSYPGGSEYKKEFIRKHLTYPQIAKEQKIEGIVELSFYVEEDGTLSDIQIVNDPGGGLGAEALRIYQAMPNWIPGSLQGRPTRVPVTETITFRLRSISYKK